MWVFELTYQSAAGSGPTHLHWTQRRFEKNVGSWMNETLGMERQMVYGDKCGSELELVRPQ